MSMYTSSEPSTIGSAIRIKSAGKSCKNPVIIEKKMVFMDIKDRSGILIR